MTIQTAPSIDNASLRAEYARLALLASQGDEAADKKLLKLERQIAEQERKERRAEAAAAETQRLAIEAEEKPNAERRAADLQARDEALKAETEAFRRIQDCIPELRDAIRSAMKANDEARMAAIRLGFASGSTASLRISNYLFWQLGCDGGAGLTHMLPTRADARLPLVKD
jgi:hypothetical protein